MTPYYWKTPRDGAQRLKALPELHNEDLVSVPGV